MLLLAVDGEMVAGSILFGLVVWVIYCVLDNEVSKPICGGCGQQTGYNFCLDCKGSGKRKIVEQIADCKHHTFVINNRIRCNYCRKTV